MDKLQILCYGDSNTWGCIGHWIETTVPTSRYDDQTRWPCVLQADLGDGFHIVEEGLGGRSTIYTREGEEWKSGEMYLKPCLHSAEEYSVKGLTAGEMKAVFEQAIWNKPAWHGDLDALHRSQAGRNMNEIGG